MVLGKEKYFGIDAKCGKSQRIGITLANCTRWQFELKIKARRKIYPIILNEESCSMTQYKAKFSKEKSYQIRNDFTIRS